MIRVRKGSPPTELVTYRASLDSTADPPRAARYDGPGFELVKPRVREALVRDQRGLCCYCMARIEASESKMKIEHRVPQRGPSGDASRDLDWTNLFGACCGAIPRASGSAVTHCDSSKGDASISIDPSEDTHTRAISYERNGRVTSSFAQHQRDIDDVLNLNCDELRARRVDAVQELKQWLSTKYPDRGYPSDKLRLLRDKVLSEPEGRPYLGFLAWWLERAATKAAR
ncbi:MAG: hypothetical protein JNK05_14035 [Myxococcales bacterium]|nr:hypothetical protein [Myxococcales bacterium]